LKKEFQKKMVRKTKNIVSWVEKYLTYGSLKDSSIILDNSSDDSEDPKES
jgi:hypothetical protein